MIENTEITAEKLEEIRQRYRPTEVPECHICGAEMTIQRMSSSRITYGCAGAIYDETGCHYAEGRSLADDHYAESRITLVDVSDPDIIALVEALEKAQGMEAYWKTQCRGITDHCEELQQRIAEAAQPAVDSEPVGYFRRYDPGFDALITQCDKGAQDSFPLYLHAQSAKGFESAGWQFKSVNGDWLGLIDEHGKNQAVREGCEVREVFAMADGVNERDQVRREHAEWSQSTFGNVGPVGPLKHLSKEALEAVAEPDDLSEWADMQFLLWDAQRRAGITDEQITKAMIEKLAVNKARVWPEPKDGEPRLHIKEQPSAVVLDEIECDICGHISTDPEGRHHCSEDNSND